MSFTHPQGVFASHGAGTVATQAVTMSAVGTGSLIAGLTCAGSPNTTGNIGSVTDNASGNTYTIVDDVADTVNGGECVTYYGPNIINGPTVITSHFSPNSSFNNIIADEFTGVATTTPLDGHAMRLQSAALTTTDAVSTGSTIGNAGDLIYGATAQTGGNSTPVHGTDFSDGAVTGQNDGNFGAISEFLTAVGAHDATFTIGTIDAMVTGALAFKPPAGTADVLYGQICL